MSQPAQIIMPAESTSAGRTLPQEQVDLTCEECGLREPHHRVGCPYREDNNA